MRLKKSLLPRSLEKYWATLKYLDLFFNTKAAKLVDIKETEKFTEWLVHQELSPIVCRERLTLIKAAWEWGIKNEYLKLNPWKEMPLRVRVPPKQMPRPFSREEINAIIQAFRTNQYYCHYADYVEFLFGTGCRTAEAIGLQWKHLNHNCSSVWIGESLTRGVRKATKTNRDRTVTLTPKLQQMLLARRTESWLSRTCGDKHGLLKQAS